VTFAWKDSEDVWQHRLGLTRDLSAQDAFIFTAEPPPCGAELELQAFLPRKGAVLSVWISGKGQVVRAEVPRRGRRGGFAVAGQRFVVRRREEGK